MKTAKNLLMLSLFLVTTVTLASVTTDFDKSVEFSKFKTFAWKTGNPPKDFLIEKRLVADIEQQMEAKGFTKVDKDPDLLVVIHTTVEEDKEINADTFGYGGFGWGGWGAWGGSTMVNVQNVPYGTLMVDMVHGSSNDLVWRGVANNIYVSNKAEKVDKKLEKAVEKMFHHFPPEPKEK